MYKYILNEKVISKKCFKYFTYLYLNLSTRERDISSRCKPHFTIVSALYDQSIANVACLSCNKGIIFSELKSIVAVLHIKKRVPLLRDVNKKANV